MKFDKQELEKKIRDAKDLSNEDKSNLLQLLKEKKTYGLVWEDSTEDAWEMMKDYVPVLKEDESRRIDHGSENPNHILIEGDNLNALTALSYTHEGNVDVIYIDPPYNTQKKDFKYNDTFIEPDNEFVHSKWLSFMNKRLIIGKTLLKREGVIFISIDDKEQADLKLLCDEIFGRHNFVAQMIWEQGKKHIGSFIGINHEYMLVYAKDKDYINDNSNKWKTKKQGLEKIYREYDRLKRQYGDNYTQIQEGMTEFYRSLADSDPSKEHKHYNKVDSKGLFFAGDLSQGTGNGPRYDVIHPVTNLPVRIPAGGWRYAENTMKGLLEKDCIYFGPDETTVPCRKRYLKETEYELPSSVFYKDGRAATKEVETILGEKGVFNNPKDREILQNVLNFKENLLIVDFFAGSGTTLHATMQLNKEDGGHRQCILVTNNENGICENVTYERNKRVIEGYTRPNGDYVEGLTNNNLRYYKIDFKERKQSHQSNRELCHEMKDLLCIKEDIYQEQHQFGSLPLKGKERMIRYFAENRREMLMVYDTRVIPFIVKEIEKMGKKEQPLKIYIFADGAYPYTDDFATVIDKVSLVPMPYAYYRGIKDSLPDVEPKKEDNTELTDEEQKQMMAEAIEAENNEKKED